MRALSEKAQTFASSDFGSPERSKNATASLPVSRPSRSLSAACAETILLCLLTREATQTCCTLCSPYYNILVLTWNQVAYKRALGCFREAIGDSWREGGWPPSVQPVDIMRCLLRQDDSSLHQAPAFLLSGGRWGGAGVEVRH